MNKTVKITYTLLPLLFLIAYPAFGVTTFGPKQYARVNGSPDIYTDAFDTVSGAGKLIVYNGKPNGDKRIPYAISSARVFLNGTRIFGPNNFSKTVYYLEAPVNLAGHNLLRVELQGEPGSYLTIVAVQEISHPVIVNFSAQPASVTQGGASTLTWNTNNAQTCIIEPGIGSVSPNGSVVVTPSETINYTLTATGPGGSANASIEVTVSNPAPTASLTASSDAIQKGESCILSWNTSNARHVYIDNEIGAVALNGSLTGLYSYSHRPGRFRFSGNSGKRFGRS